MPRPPSIVFSKAYHKGHEVLLIGFKYNMELKEYLKKFKGMEWSITLRSFYLLYNKEITNILFKYLRDKDYYIDYSALKTKKEDSEIERSIKKAIIGHEISDEILHEINEFKRWMSQKRYSKNTINTYESMLLLFFRFQHPKAVNAITEKDVINLIPITLWPTVIPVPIKTRPLMPLNFFTVIMVVPNSYPTIWNAPKNPGSYRMSWPWKK